MMRAFAAFCSICASFPITFARILQSFLLHHFAITFDAFFGQTKIRPYGRVARTYVFFSVHYALCASPSEILVIWRKTLTSAKSML